MRTRPPGSACAGCSCAVLLLASLSAASARADEPVAGTHRAEPPRYVGALTVGTALRLTRNVEFDQGVLAPAYVDVLGGYVLSSPRRLRHGFGVGLAMNVSADGGFTEPVDAGGQLVVMPAYLLYWTLANEWFGLAHLGVPIVASGGRNAGIELGFAAGYRLLAGFGAYAEAALDVFAGAGSTWHPSLALEAGVFLEHEVLP